MLEVLSHHASIAIENARLFEANLKAERLAAIGQAVAGLAHYVKNIVTGMKGSSSLVECAIQEKSYDMLPRAWDILKRSTDRVSVLVQDMLTYSKERKPEMTIANVNSIVGDVVALYMERARKSGIEVATNFSEDLPSIPIDETGIHRCFMNFVGNAIDAVAWPDRKNPDPGKIEVETWLGDDGKNVTVMVRDNGIGIDQKVLDKIWEPFWSTKGSRGTGLGLAVTKKILTEHGARVETKSVVGKGTEFRIHLNIPYLNYLLETIGPAPAKG
jgi:signal transduction histidine kinase